MHYTVTSEPSNRKYGTQSAVKRRRQPASTSTADTVDVISHLKEVQQLMDAVDQRSVLKVRFEPCLAASASGSQARATTSYASSSLA